MDHYWGFMSLKKVCGHCEICLQCKWACFTYLKSGQVYCKENVSSVNISDNYCKYLDIYVLCIYNTYPLYMCQWSHTCGIIHLVWFEYVAHFVVWRWDSKNRLEVVHADCVLKINSFSNYVINYRVCQDKTVHLQSNTFSNIMKNSYSSWKSCSFHNIMCRNSGSEVTG